MLLAWSGPVEQKIIIHTGNQRSIKAGNDTVERRRRREEPTLTSELCGRREGFSGLLTLSCI